MYKSAQGFYYVEYPLGSEVLLRTNGNSAQSVINRGMIELLIDTGVQG